MIYIIDIVFYPKDNILFCLCSRVTLTQPCIFRLDRTKRLIRAELLSSMAIKPFLLTMMKVLELIAISNKPLTWPRPESLSRFITQFLRELYTMHSFYFSHEHRSCSSRMTLVSWSKLPWFSPVRETLRSRRLADRDLVTSLFLRRQFVYP